jgi:cytochrome c biogenesis protein CcmG/thiol:disulfide interchange protein DsbE
VKAGRGRRALVASVVVGAVSAVLVAVLATRSTPPGSTVATRLGGRMAPVVAGPALVGGEPVSLAALRGKYVLLDFFASWCVPCQQEVPQIEAFLFAHRRAHDVAAIGVDIDENAADGRAFLERVGATWPAVEDPSGARSFALAYDVTDPPESYLISPSGRVVAEIAGGVTVASLDRVLADARAAAGGSGT